MRPLHYVCPSRGEHPLPNPSPQAGEGEERRLMQTNDPTAPYSAAFMPERTSSISACAADPWILAMSS